MVMDLSKSYEYFNPTVDKSTIHIIGCGSVGSTVAENLARNGVENFQLWDFDKVEGHNIVNQMFTQDQVGMLKVDALRDILVSINPVIAEKIKLHPEGWQGKKLSGVLVMAVDSIELRNKIVDTHWNYPFVKVVFDYRTSLESAQHYAADWGDLRQKEALKASMNFSHEEAMEETPVSACGVTLGVATTVRMIAALGVNNYINWVKSKNLWKFAQIDGFHGVLDVF